MINITQIQNINKTNFIQKKFENSVMEYKSQILYYKNFATYFLVMYVPALITMVFFEYLFYKLKVNRKLRHKQIVINKNKQKGMLTQKQKNKLNDLNLLVSV